MRSSNPCASSTVGTGAGASTGCAAGTSSGTGRPGNRGGPAGVVGAGRNGGFDGEVGSGAVGDSGDSRGGAIAPRRLSTSAMVVRPRRSGSGRSTVGADGAEGPGAIDGAIIPAPATSDGIPRPMRRGSPCSMPATISPAPVPAACPPNSKPIAFGMACRNTGPPGTGTAAKGASGSISGSVIPDAISPTPRPASRMVWTTGGSTAGVR